MLMSASKQTLLLYWDIGKMVSEKIELAGWGKSVVEQLAKDLQTEIPGVRGFSARNIWNMKKFADFYAALGISATTVAEIEVSNISAIVEAEMQSIGNQRTAIVQNSATMAAEIQGCIFELVTNVGRTQNCIIIEKRPHGRGNLQSLQPTAGGIREIFTIGRRIG